MAKKRRKIDKIRAQNRLARTIKNTTAKNGNSLNPVSGQVEKKEEEQCKLATLFNYDPQLINQDLKKTLLVTLVILVVLALITLRYT